MQGKGINPIAREAETVFNVASNLASTERAAYLARVCGADTALRRRVEALLRAHDGLGGFLPDAPKHSAGAGPRPIAGEIPGEFVGRYQLLEKIGEGGCGIVYLAQQEEPVRRRVALKVIKAGMDTRAVVARFEAERQALAMMDHPNIARVLDGGATESERPYFVMELVGGLRITDYCAQNQFTTRQRLELFIQVCQAVQHAHQKGIIHRDLKPSNILVTEQDGRPVPKVIDFGIAKAIAGRLTEETLVTGLGQIIGTPAYMSPEQLALTSVDVDTRSDIYSLGVLLYELLSDRTPFDGKELLAAGLDELRRTIREVEPVKPSTRLTQARAARPAGSAKSEIQNPKSEIDQDLDWIVMRCLEKDRNRRYETANGLAADLKRHLGNEPVLARPPGNLYRFRKMVRRNKGAFALTSLIALTLLLGIATTSWQAIRARRAEQQERLERARAEKRLAATMRFFDQAFTSVAPALGDVIGAARPRELLARAAAETLEDLREGDPPDAKSRAVLGQLYQQLAKSHGWFTGNKTGDYEAAFKAVTNAIRFRESVAADSPTDASVTDLGYSEQAAGIICDGLLKFPEAIEHFQKCEQWAVRLRQQTTNSFYLGQSELLEGAARGNVGAVLFRSGRVEEALTNSALPALDRLQAKGNVEQSTNIWDVWGAQCVNHSVGEAYHHLGRSPEALPYMREALRLGELINQRKPHSAQFASALAVVRADAGKVLLCLHRPDEGLPLLETAVSLADELAGRDPANAGFVQVQVEVHGHGAAGCAAWAGDPSASLADRTARLNQAQTHLDRAQTLLAGLKSESFRKSLKWDLDPVSAKVAQARMLLESKGGPE